MCVCICMYIRPCPHFPPSSSFPFIQNKIIDHHPLTHTRSHTWIVYIKTSNPHTHIYKHNRQYVPYIIPEPEVAVHELDPRYAYLILYTYTHIYINELDIYIHMYMYMSWIYIYIYICT